MMCYTRNFEDVILQRVLADVAKGCYLDVGASQPVFDSNTYALYQKGWRGVALEPLPYQQFWQQTRPEDLFLCAAVGAQEGWLPLHVYDQALQGSSGSIDSVLHLQRSGLQPTRRVEVPMLTLNQVIAKYVLNKAVHLLSIDVEGMEYEVLKGLDLQAHRPWVIVLEATLPGCPTPGHHAWEPYLLAASYLMVYFDGVNRFYLAHEQRNLLGRFALPPNVWDGFVSAEKADLEAQVKQLQKQVTSLQAQLAQSVPLRSVFQ